MSDYWGMYLIACGVMLLIYVAVRICIWDCRRLPKEKRDNRPGSAIDASPLAKRLAQVKDAYAGEVPRDQAAFKRPLRVAQRRQEIAQIAYLEKPVEVGEPEKHDGLMMILV